jgi:hypothetical protein
MRNAKHTYSCKCYPAVALLNLRNLTFDCCFVLELQRQGKATGKTRFVAKSNPAQAADVGMLKLQQKLVERRAEQGRR